MIAHTIGDMILNSIMIVIWVIVNVSDWGQDDCSLIIIHAYVQWALKRLRHGSPPAAS